MELSFFQTFHAIPSILYGHGHIGVGPEEVMKMIRGLKYLSHKDRLRALGFQPGEEKVPGTP